MGAICMCTYIYIYIYEDKFSLMRVGAYGLQFLSSGFGFTVSVLG